MAEHYAIHHTVPRFLLAAFSTPDYRLIEIDRHTMARRETSPRGASGIPHFYKRDAPDDPDPLRFETKLAGEIENEAAPVIAKLRERFPPSNKHRKTLARFLALQAIRGQDQREMIDTVINRVVGLAARVVGRRRGVAMLRSIGYPLRDDGTGLAKDAHIDLQEQLAQELRSVMRMRMALVRFDEPMLITSDRPLVNWGVVNADTPPLGVGLNAPRGLSIHIDPRHALLVAREDIPWPEQTAPIRGTRANADVLNYHAACFAYDRIFHHPDHEPLAGMKIPPRQSLDSMLDESVAAGLRSRPWPVRVAARWLLGLK